MSHIESLKREELISILNQDALYRKIGEWPLLKLKDIKILNIQRNAVGFYLHKPDYFIKSDINSAEKRLKDKFPFIDKLVSKFSNNLIACGGAITKSILDFRNLSDYQTDIDLFFYNINNLEEANKLRIEAINYLVSLWEDSGLIEEDDEDYQYGIPMNGYYILRNEFTTTVYCRSDHRSIKYQFIHRIYPNINSILGGFDISASMVTYDGVDFLATPFGAWSIKNRAIIIDTKRRSTSFEYRLMKYQKYGFALLFPGLPMTIDSFMSSKKIENEEMYIKEIKQIESKTKFDINDDLIKFITSDEVKKIGKIYGFKINEVAWEEKGSEWGDEKKGGVSWEVTGNGTVWENKNFDLDIKLNKIYINTLNYWDVKAVQLRENVLPYIQFSTYKNSSRSHRVVVRKKPYDYEKVEDRFITEISDYDSYNSDPFNCVNMNMMKLRTNQLNSVCSIIKSVNGDKFKELLINDLNNPDLLFNYSEANKFRERCNLFATEYMNKDLIDYDYNDICMPTEFRRILKLFGKFAPNIVNVFKNNDKDTYDKYVEMMIDNMFNNAKICKEKLVGVNWITKNPGRQWTSSINPIIKDPRDWYGSHYIPVVTGIPHEIETCLRLARLRSMWAFLPKEIFDKILFDIAKCYADEAWKYIL